MNGTLTEAMRFVAAVVITAALIAIVVLIFIPAGESAKETHAEVTANTAELKDQKYLIYENTTISGSQVISALRKFQNEGKELKLALYVQTGKNGTDGTWYYSQFVHENSELSLSTVDNLTDAMDSTHANYINPSGLFKANVQRDSNGVIRAIKFIQQVSK